LVAMDSITLFDLRAVERRLEARKVAYGDPQPTSVLADCAALLAEVRALREVVRDRCRDCREGLAVFHSGPYLLHRETLNECRLSTDDRAALARVTDDATETG
jgi:hypothetical protein